MADLMTLYRRAETADQVAALCRVNAQAVALAADHGYSEYEISTIHVADDGRLASIECGQDADGMARIVLNFAL